MINKNASPEMRTATYNVDAASGRCRRQNVPRHILCYVTNNKSHEGIPPQQAVEQGLCEERKGEEIWLRKKW